MIVQAQTTTPIPDDAEDPMVRILSEMGFFLCLLLTSEAVRWTVKQRPTTPDYIGQVLWICTLVLSWYTVSITLILFNKWIISSWHGEGLTFPIFYTSMHMLLKGLFATMFFCCFGKGHLPSIDSRSFTGLSIAGSCAALDIVGSNLSMVYISASYYTFLKSSALIFYLILAVMIGVEHLSVAISSTVLLVSLGMFLTSYGEADFSGLGFGLVVGSEAFAAIRWIVTQMMVQDEGISAMVAVLCMAPASTLTLVPAVFARERGELSDAFNNMGDVWDFCALVCFPGFLAFLLLLVEVQLVKETSGLTLTIFGNLKSVCTIIFAILVFGETTSCLQWVGLAVAIIGMITYTHAKESYVERNEVFMKSDAATEQDGTRREYDTFEKSAAA